ncbi:M48 family metalloprotease [Salinivibrio proteolyticus]|uniref:beta-barrel assembly-enhancing protease n=1 Tax=Salinivibrio proteolyticus TaxID=334715 RepID=UPI000988D9B5|nr:M48 family metalloprotease [Salinivibrio proteolyticus]
MPLRALRHSHSLLPSKRSGRRLLAYLLAGLLATAPATASTEQYGFDLPDIGTAAAGTLTIAQEKEFGDAYMRMLRASKPIISDPLLSEYVNALGHRLVANANDVRTPFQFILINNQAINAFAFFGGYVAMHSGLFLHANTESELASVMAHEIAHVTQRHLARSMEDQAKKSPLTVAALVGSLMLAIAAPEAGIAAAHAATAGTIQSRINYTRRNEEEADRIGIDTLARADFDVSAMPRFFTRLADEYRYASKMPEYFSTHPLPESRITDSRARARQYPQKRVPLSPDYHLARARIVARYSGIAAESAMDWFARKLKKASPAEKQSLNYGVALLHIDAHRFDEARALLKPLIQAQPNNRFFIDAMTDLDIGEKHFDKALSRLNDALANQPDNRVLLLNRAYTYVKAQRGQEAIPALERYTHQYPDDSNGWFLLQQAYESTGTHRDGELAAQGERYALRGQWSKAIRNYTQASQLVELGSLAQARYDARLDQLRHQQARFNALKDR